MCGIAGILSSSQKELAESVRRMNGGMIHRGPDASGFWEGRSGAHQLVFGHQRLSIIDLSPLGNQPMVSHGERHVLVFNGEIYNYRELRRELETAGDVFKSHSDTEVLLLGFARYGEDFVRRLEGMYAFAFYDKEKGLVLLARDPIGIKPLYYTTTDDTVVFASELRALLRSGMVGRGICREAVAGYMAYGSVSQPRTLLSSVRMLEPGSVMKVELKPDGKHSITRNRWWTMPSVGFEGTETEAIERTSTLLHQSIESHLIADVPVGVFLSAGIDSTLITAIAKSFSDSVRSFTVSVSSKETSDEGFIAANTAKQIGIEHTSIQVSHAQAMSSASKWLSSTDQPSIDGLNTFLISECVRSEGIKVALSGLGADELFGGYPSFLDVPRVARFAKLGNWFPQSMRRFAANAIGRSHSQEARSKFADMVASGRSIGQLALLRRRLMSDEQMRSLGFEHTNEMGQMWLGHEELADIPTGSSSSGWAISAVESQYYQRNMLLRDSDAQSMAHSLELRVPFLDQRLLDFVPTIPDSIRFPRRSPQKHLLREAGKKYLSRIHLERAKTGFVLPLAEWMQGPLRELCEGYIDTVRHSGVLDQKGMDSIWSAFLANPTSNASTRAISLVSLGAALQSIKE